MRIALEPGFCHHRNHKLIKFFKNLRTGNHKIKKFFKNLRTGSGFARTNLALVLCTRSRGDAHGGETDISKPPICIFPISSFAYFLSSTTSHPCGVLRPTDCLGRSGRIERSLNCPAPPPPPSRLRRQLMRLPRPWQVKAEKPSSRVPSQGQALH